MTVRDLLMHTSGLVARDTQSPVGELYRRDDLRGSESDGTLAEMVQKLGQAAAPVDPGTRWIYGISTDLVGYLCEVIGGMPFDRFLRGAHPRSARHGGHRVQRARLRKSTASPPAMRRTGARPRYQLADDPRDSGYIRPRTYFSGAGGIVSTAADYYCDSAGCC